MATELRDHDVFKGIGEEREVFSLGGNCREQKG